MKKKLQFLSLAILLQTWIIAQTPKKQTSTTTQPEKKQTSTTTQPQKKQTSTTTQPENKQTSTTTQPENKQTNTTAQPENKQSNNLKTEDLPRKNKNAIKLTPFTFLSGRACMVTYERVLTKRMTVGLGVAPVFGSPLFSIGAALSGMDFKFGYGIDTEIRWYATKSDRVLDGFFFGLYNSNRTYRGTSTTGIYEGNGNLLFSFDPNNPTPTLTENKNLNIKITKSLFGIQFGTHRLIGNHFSFDLYSGLGIGATTTVAKFEKNNEVYNSFGLPAFNFRLNFAFGWQF